MDHHAALRRNLLWALALLALTAGGMHLRIHPPFIPPGTGGLPEANLGNILALSLSLADFALVTLLFSRKATAVYGYLLNGMLGILGGVLMIHYGFIHWQAYGDVPKDVLLSGPSFALLILLADFLTGASLYRVWMAPPSPPPLAEERRMAKAA